MATHQIGVDLANVYASADRTELLTVLPWAFPVEVIAITADHVEIRCAVFTRKPDGSLETTMTPGFIVPSARSGLTPPDIVVAATASRVLKIDFVDVQQGDGAVIETAEGRIVLVDGGDNQLFARYLASRYRGTSAAAPREIDCLLVTHGDADHFAGLTEIHESETHHTAHKRLFIHPARVYHNGLVKRPTEDNGRRRKETEMLGATADTPEGPVITGLETDLLAVPAAELNRPFAKWQEALRAFAARGPIEFRRLQQGDHAAFDFLRPEGVDIQVLGPMPVSVNGAPALPLLREPKRGPRVGHDVTRTDPPRTGSLSASHTINGHSIVFRLTYGRVHVLFTGDLNDEAGRALARAHDRGEIDLRAEIFKVPHHGSADFSGAFLKAVAPVVSVVSSGDENARKEYIHPRATLIGALGRYSQVEEPLVFVTELVAFFEVEDWVTPERHVMKNGAAVVTDGAAAINAKAKPPFFAFSRAAFGIVMVRTDGERLLVYTNSGRTDLKEAYAYTFDAAGRPVPAPVRRA